MNQFQPLWGLGGSPPGDGWPQRATYPQSPFSGPEVLLRRSVPVPGILAVTPDPGRLWISLGTILLPDSLSRDGQNQTMN